MGNCPLKFYGCIEGKNMAKFFMRGRSVKKLLGMLTIVLITTLPISANDYFCSKKVINKVESHTAIVLGYFENEHGTYNVSYGAGAVLRDNYVISACHIVEDSRLTLSNIYVIVKGRSTWVKADIVAMGHPYPEYDDYVILKPKEDVGLPGLKIAKKPLKLLQKVLFSGTPGGLAFVVRGGYVSKVQYYMETSGDDFALKRWADEAMPMVYVGYPGDSGGMITNTKGEIQSLMTWGFTGKTFVFGNPVTEIWKFLKTNNLEKIGR